MAHFLRKRGTEEVFIFTNILSKRQDMQLIDAKDLVKAKEMARRSLTLEQRAENVVEDAQPAGPRPLTELELADEEEAAGVNNEPPAVTGAETPTPEPATGTPAPSEPAAPEGSEPEAPGQGIALEKPLTDMTKAELGDVAQNNFGIELDQANKKEELVAQVQSMIDKPDSE